MEKHIVVGIYRQEIFIAAVENGEIKHWDVLRPVSESCLETLRQEDEIKEYCRDLWVAAVRAGATEQSLDEYVEDIIAECEMEDNKEMYPGKDESDCEYLLPELREEADAYMLTKEGVEIGTWESSGGYSPNTRWRTDEPEFKKWDYVFNNTEAKKIAKMFEESLKK